MLNKEILKLIEELEETVIAHRPRKSLLSPIKGKSYAEGRIGSLELKKCIERLSKDDESQFVVEGLVYGCLMLGEDAGRYLTISQAKEHFKPFIVTQRKQVESGKLQESRFKKPCLDIAKLTWLEYPEASSASLARKLYDHFDGDEKKLKLATIEKIWLNKCTFRPKERSIRKLEYKLIHPI